MTTKRYVPVTVILVLSLVLFLGVACGGSDSGDNDSPTDTPDATDIAAGTPAPNATVEPGATSDDGGGDATPSNSGPTTEADATAEAVSDSTDRNVRDLERSAQKVNALFRILSSRIGQSSPSLRGTPAEDSDNSGRWFSDCCDNITGDFREEFDSMTRLLPELRGIYDGAGDSESVAAVDEIGANIANIEASIAVMAGLPTSEGAADIVADISSDLQALTEAIAKLQ